MVHKNIAIGNFRTKLDAEIAGGVLTNEEIPHLIQSAEGMLHGPIPTGATIYVSSDVAERAKKLLLEAGLLPTQDAD